MSNARNAERRHRTAMRLSPFVHYGKPSTPQWRVGGSGRVRAGRPSCLDTAPARPRSAAGIPGQNARFRLLKREPCRHLSDSQLHAAYRVALPSRRALSPAAHHLEQLDFVGEPLQPPRPEGAGTRRPRGRLLSLITVGDQLPSLGAGRAGEPAPPSLPPAHGDSGGAALIRTRRVEWFVFTRGNIQRAKMGLCTVASLSLMGSPCGGQGPVVRQ